MRGGFQAQEASAKQPRIFSLFGQPTFDSGPRSAHRPCFPTHSPPSSSPACRKWCHGAIDLLSRIFSRDSNLETIYHRSGDPLPLTMASRNRALRLATHGFCRPKACDLRHSPRTATAVRSSTSSSRSQAAGCISPAAPRYLYWTAAAALLLSTALYHTVRPLPRSPTSSPRTPNSSHPS